MSVSPLKVPLGSLPIPTLQKHLTENRHSAGPHAELTPGFLGETWEEHVPEGRQDPKANKLLEPGILQLGGGVLQGRRVPPHHLDVLAVWLPERLLKLQEDFIVGPKAYLPDRFRLLGGQWWLKEGVQTFFKKTWNS